LPRWCLPRRGDAPDDDGSHNDDVTGRSAALPAAGLLGVAALIEVALTAGPSAAFPLFTVLALVATAPVAIAATRPEIATVAIATACVVSLLAGMRPPVAGLVGLAATACLTVRKVVRHRRAEAAARDASSRALTDTLLENKARGERARIARELHDVVAHHISLIALQADTVRLTTTGLPVEGAAGLVTIGDTARTALTEMRRLLGVLRADTGEEPERVPQPGLQQLNDLVDATRAAGGTTARLIVQGAVRPLSPGLELTAYRIVQEALSNSRRHAPGAGIDVDLRYGEDELRVRVRDNGPATADGTSGHGLTGMRERAAMIGGIVTAGPADPAGFLVEAVLPISGDRS
jgi:signal transduction histidine kinase